MQHSYKHAQMDDMCLKTGRPGPDADVWVSSCRWGTRWAAPSLQVWAAPAELAAALAAEGPGQRQQQVHRQVQQQQHHRQRQPRMSPVRLQLQPAVQGGWLRVCWGLPPASAVLAVLQRLPRMTPALAVLMLAVGLASAAAAAAVKEPEAAELSVSGALPNNSKRVVSMLETKPLLAC